MRIFHLGLWNMDFLCVSCSFGVTDYLIYLQYSLRRMNRHSSFLVYRFLGLYYQKYTLLIALDWTGRSNVFWYACSCMIPVVFMQFLRVNAACMLEGRSSASRKTIKDERTWIIKWHSFIVSQILYLNIEMSFSMKQFMSRNIISANRLNK